MHSALSRVLLAATLFCSWAQPAHADTYPSKPITLVVTQGTGSGSDVMARLLAGYLGPMLGQTVVVENRAGASGILGHQSVARANPDGYTLLFTSTAGLFVVPVMNPNAQYSLADYVPVAPVMRAPFAVLVANTPAAPKTMAELMAGVRALMPQAYSCGAQQRRRTASMRGAMDVASIHSSGPWSPPPIGPRPSMVGTPMLEAHEPSDAPAAIVSRATAPTASSTPSALAAKGPA